MTLKGKIDKSLTDGTIQLREKLNDIMQDIDKKLDIEHSKHIRLKNTNEYGIGYCYTCNARLTYKTAQCGHYPNVSRENMRFRWDIEIHKIQCNECNCVKFGNPEAFRDRLVDEMGSDKISKIEFESKVQFKWYHHDKEQLLSFLKSQNKKLIKDKMIQI